MNTTEIRYATEKQINLINKFANEETYGRCYSYIARKMIGYSCGIMLEELRGLNVALLTIAAASDIIGECLDFKSNISCYDRMACDEFDAKIKLYAKELKSGRYDFVPKINMLQGEKHIGETKLMPSGEYWKEEDWCDWSGEFDYSTEKILVELSGGEFIDTDNTPQSPNDDPQEDFDEDWYCEGSGQYWEDRAESLAGEI